MVLRRVTFVHLFIVIVVALALPAIALSQATVYTDETAFDAATGAVALAFPLLAESALPNQPYALSGYSCGPTPPGIDLPWGSVSPVVNVQAPNATAGDASCRIFFLGSGWNAGSGNISPKPTSPTIVGNGEDDLRLNFNLPVYAVGLKLLTNSSAYETVTITYTDASSEVVYDINLSTDPNAFEFIGFKSTKPISSVLIDNTGGASQNEGLYGVKIVLAVSIDIKPCSDPNAVNLGSAGVVPVAILGSADFDVSQVDPSTVKLAGLAVKTVGKTDKLLCHIEDVVGPNQSCGPDGYPDLVCQMLMTESAPGDATWVLQATTYGGLPVSGSDNVKIVP